VRWSRCWKPAPTTASACPLPQEITLRLSRALHIKQASDLLEDSEAVTTALAAAIESRDPYTCGHVERVAMYAVTIGKRVGVDAGGLNALQRGGVVHDIGKIVVPDQILNKTGQAHGSGDGDCPPPSGSRA